MKLITLEATFPELPSSKMYQTARAEATSIPTAVRLALKEILGRDGIKRRRLTTIKLLVSVSSNGNGEERRVDKWTT